MLNVPEMVVESALKEISMSELTAAKLRDVLHYDPETGVFTWVAARQKVRVGEKAGCIENTGYVRIRLFRRIYCAHRLAWLYMTGEWPVDFVDHINGARADNRWANLRAATKSQNMSNSRRIASNTTGLKGVSRAGNRFRASIQINGQARHLGSFRNAEDAHAAYLAAARQNFGEFANPG
jgi:hypothetical protein